MIEEQENKPKIEHYLKNRPAFMLFMLFCTLLSSSMNVLSYVFYLVSGQIPQEDLDSEKANALLQYASIQAQYPEYYDDIVQILDLTYFINAKYQIYSLVMIVIYALGVYAAVSIFRGEKKGLNYYVGYSLLGVISIFSVAPFSQVPSIYLFIQAGYAAILIFIYSRFSKHLQ